MTNTCSYDVINIYPPKFKFVIWDSIWQEILVMQHPNFVVSIEHSTFSTLNFFSTLSALLNIELFISIEHSSFLKAFNIQVFVINQHSTFC